LETW